MIHRIAHVIMYSEFNEFKRVVFHLVVLRYRNTSKWYHVWCFKNDVTESVERIHSCYLALVSDQELACLRKYLLILTGILIFSMNVEKVRMMPLNVEKVRMMPLHEFKANIFLCTFHTMQWHCYNRKDTGNDRRVIPISQY